MYSPKNILILFHTHDYIFDEDVDNLLPAQLCSTSKIAVFFFLVLMQTDQYVHFSFLALKYSGITFVLLCLFPSRATGHTSSPEGLHTRRL